MPLGLQREVRDRCLTRKYTEKEVREEWELKQAKDAIGQFPGLALQAIRARAIFTLATKAMEAVVGMATRSPVAVRAGNPSE